MFCQLEKLLCVCPGTKYYYFGAFSSFAILCEITNSVPPQYWKFMQVHCNDDTIISKKQNNRIIIYS